MPHTEQAYQAGEIYGAHVDLVAACDRQWRNATFSDAEELLVNLCRTPFFGVAARGIDYWKQCTDLDAADREADTVRTGRHLSASVTFNGTVAIDGVGYVAVLQAAAHELGASTTGEYTLLRRG